MRTYPVTFLHDTTQTGCDPRWHLLIFAARGNLEVITDASRWLVPADRAVWIPAGTRFTSVMRAPISMRSIYVARAAMRDARRIRTVAVAPLLRELILHVTRLGALDRAVAEQARLAGVLFDLLRGADEVPLELPSPRDPRARRFAELVAEPAHARALLRERDRAAARRVAPPRAAVPRAAPAAGRRQGHRGRARRRLRESERVLAGVPARDGALAVDHAASYLARMSIAALVELARGRRVVALTGAGCSTESGIPDYRGPARRRARAPMQHREFVDRADARRALLGAARCSAGRAWPRRGRTPATRALAALEERGVLAGVITQNVDCLHAKAGSRAVVELHGAIARVRCLACGARSRRATRCRQRLARREPGWLAAAHGPLAPDGDVELAANSSPLRGRRRARRAAASSCPTSCSSAAASRAPTLDAAWQLFDRAELLLVLGSSLAVF